MTDHCITRADFDLEEYRALRAEIIQSMDDGNQVMSLGLASIGVVFGAAVSVKGTDVGFYVFVICLPVLSALVLSYWFAAQERIARASHYLSGVEGRLKAAVSDRQGVSWEAWLRLPPPAAGRSHRSRTDQWLQRSWNAELSGIVLFTLAMFGALATGWATSHHVAVSGLAKIGSLALSLTVCLLILLHVRSRYRDWRRWLRTEFDPSVWEAHARHTEGEPQQNATGN